jgi:hypothetical protein
MAGGNNCCAATRLSGASGPQGDRHVHAHSGQPRKVLLMLRLLLLPSLPLLRALLLLPPQRVSGCTTALTVVHRLPWPCAAHAHGRGEGAKRRGTGSFHIPHRLSADERPIFEASKKKVRHTVAVRSCELPHAPRSSVTSCHGERHLLEMWQGMLAHYCSIAGCSALGILGRRTMPIDQ